MRRVRRKGGNKEKVFGCDLLEHLNASSQEIPLVLRSCSEFVETHGIVDGIYRLSGVSSNIQKLRGEFENDATPDLNKDVYLQDIHCISSLCKAYFRELPNPLLTYQLYDKFAEAVAIQLEEERLVKIRDVLKELPRPHYRTLEFLMRHLVRMASYSSETNMHARNLAIVWAPNLLRSKDIEASGFNGTAAFMEVRVQSIVVEFILTHVPQLFPEHGVSTERRKSLPSPSAESNQEEGFFKPAPTQPVLNFGNISPGDGPLPIRPYHAIIEGTDKRKGSLKGRKWMSIFNIGGRFPDPRRRHKHSAKEKDRPVLRPARSMDSLSTPSFPNEGPRRSAQRPPSTHNSTPSPLATSSPQPGADVSVSSGAIGVSEYAVTYRRGTGLVSGGAGTQGTYTALDPEGLGLTGTETVQSRSPGISTKVGRRAAMHITGPTMVTVPLHITSNLALGLLQGGGSDRVIHRSRDKDGGDRVEGKEGGEKVERSESRGKEAKVEESREVEEEEKKPCGEVTEREAEGSTVAGGGEEKEGEEKKEEEEEEEVREECRSPELAGGGCASREQRVKSSNTEEDNGEDAVDDDKDIDEYMDMKGVAPADLKPEATEPVDDRVFDASDILNSTEVEADDLGLSGYVQDNFEFLDQMDCSAMDHMDCSVSYQVNEFSVEPPGHSDDEYEVMAQAQPSFHPAEVHTHLRPDPELKPHRPLSLDINSRHTKSLSLPYMTSPVHGPEESCSEEDLVGDDSDVDDYSSDEDECMFVKSLPPDFFLSHLPEFEANSDEQVGYTLDGVPAQLVQISEDGECNSMNLEFTACKVTTAGDEEQVEVKDEKDEDGLEEKEITKTEEEEEDTARLQRRDELENKKQSEATEEGQSVVEEARCDSEEPLTSDESTRCCCCADDPLPSNDESSTVTEMTVEEEEEVVDLPPCHAVACVTHEELKDETERPSARVREDVNERDSGEGEDRDLYKEIEDMCHEMDLEMAEYDESMCEQSTEEGREALADIKHEENMQEGDEEQGICGTSRDIWREYEEVVCEVIEDEENEQVERGAARESIAGEGDTIEDVKVVEEEEQTARVSVDEMLEADGGGTDDSVEESTETEEQTVETEMQQELAEKETNLPKMSEATQGKYAIDDEAQHRDGGEAVSKDKQNKERNDEQPPSVDPVRLEVKESKEGRKCEESDGSPGGVGRKLVVSKHPKVYQVKAVPVVPPKPQHCKITALTLRQQQQQRDRRDADRGRENSTEQEKVFAVDQGSDLDEGRANKEKPTLRERRRDGDESAAREASRNSPLSMCFDEAVAIATMRRGKEKECEKEKERQREWGNEVQ